MTPTTSRSRRTLAWMRQHPFRTLTLVFVLAFTVLNVLAYQHARAFLYFRQGGERSPPPQSLTTLQKLTVLACGASVPRPENARSPADFNVPFTTQLIASGDGAVLEAWLLAPPEAHGIVLLFHGYAKAKDCLLPEALAFRELGYAVMLVDFRGSGGSNGHSTSVGYYEGLDVAAAVAAVRSLGLRGPLILYGQSMGGAAVLRGIAAHGVQADALILESVFDRLLTTAQNRFALMGVPSFPAAELLIFWGGVQAGFSGFSHNPVDYAARCACPTLMLHAEQDRNAKLDEARTIYEQLRGQKRLETFPEVGHTPLQAAAPRQWRRAVAAFLADHGTRSAQEPQ